MTTLELPAWPLGQARGCHSKLVVASSGTGLGRAPATWATLISFHVISCNSCLLLKPSNWGVYSCYFSALFSPSQHSCSDSTVPYPCHARARLPECHLLVPPSPSQEGDGDKPFPEFVMLPSLRGRPHPPSLRCPGDTEVSTLCLSPKAVPNRCRRRTGLENRDDPHLCAFGTI